MRLALVTLLALGCNKPSPQAVTRYQLAHAAASMQLEAAEKDFEAAVAEARDGRWVPRAELGACAVPVDPKSAWSIDAPTGVAGWDTLGQRVFDALQLGASDYHRVADADELLAETTRLEGLGRPPDVFFLYVDALKKPRIETRTTFVPGEEKGRAWVYGSATGKIVCAGTFESKSSKQVSAELWLGQSRQDTVEGELLRDLRRLSTTAASTKLVAAGAPAQ